MSLWRIIRRVWLLVYNIFRGIKHMMWPLTGLPSTVRRRVLHLTDNIRRRFLNVEYHGLLNQGATCYLNSVLQVLYMTTDFREAVKRYTDKDPECIDSHLNDLFDDLKRHTAQTHRITNRLGISRVNQQQDAAQYYEKILNLTSREASEIFHGELTHKTICSKCQTETNRDAPFWHLPLPLTDPYSGVYSLVGGIEEYFRDSYLSGLDQMYCEDCDDKADATTKTEVKHHPEVLMLLLKRFEFNYDYMTYVKINHVVDFPYTLQIPENQTYNLYAVVDHSGDLGGGHYSATIRSQDDERWYNFDDTRVTLCDYQPFQLDNKEKTAYLLFYRKQKTPAADTCTEGPREVSISGDVPPAVSNNYNQNEESEETERGEEVGEAVEVGSETAEAVSVDRNEETEVERRKSDTQTDIRTENMRTGPVEETSCNRENQKEICQRTRGSKNPSIQHRFERRKNSDTQSSFKTKKMKTGLIEETSHSSKNRGNQKETCDAKTDESVHSLNQTHSHFHEPKKNSTSGNRNTSEENEMISKINSNDEEIQKVSDEQVEAAGLKHQSKKRSEKKRKRHVKRLTQKKKEDKKEK